jgi:hypothetical protein
VHRTLLGIFWTFVRFKKKFGEERMSLTSVLKTVALVSTVMCWLAAAAERCDAGQNKVMSEVHFEATSKVERDAGVWVDGGYVGYLKELKGSKKVLLLPGQHEVSVRESGYDDFTKKITVEPGQDETVMVTLIKNPKAITPDVTATLKLKIEPKRAAVFLDDKFVGHAGEFGGKFRSMLISPGKHRIKVELPGYQTFETEVNLLAGQKSEVKTELAKGSIEQAGPLIKQQQ